MVRLHPREIPKPSGKRRWRIAALLAAGVLVSYIDRVNLTVAHSALTSGFGISKTQFGFLLSAYNFTYCLCQLPIGPLLDRFGVRRVGRASTLLWSIASFAAAGATSLRGLWAARFLLGIGESPLFPSNAKATGNWFPRHERSLATAIFDSAAKFASGIGVPLIGTLLLLLGWRVSFAITGLLSSALLCRVLHGLSRTGRRHQAHRRRVVLHPQQCDGAHCHRAR